jgi:hypothetical protein
MTSRLTKSSNFSSLLQMRQILYKPMQEMFFWQTAISYQEPIYLPDENKSAVARKDPSSKSIFASGVLKIFPNPADQYVIVEYDFPTGNNLKEASILSMISNDGKSILKKELKRSSDQVVVDCRNLSAGSYLCRINKGKRTLGSAKFVIVK